MSFSLLLVATDGTRPAMKVSHQWVKRTLTHAPAILLPRYSLSKPGSPLLLNNRQVFVLFLTWLKSLVFYPESSLTCMAGYVFCSLVDFSPGMLPALLPSHSYLKRSPFEAGCSVMRTWAPRF